LKASVTGNILAGGQRHNSLSIEDFGTRVRLLRRYLIRQFIGPFVFALSAMTSIMLLNQVAKRFGALVGKGLPWSVIGEVFALCIPFILAMTLPMAVLVAMLYTFSHLAADNEVTAMRASGLSVYQLLRPMVGVGLVLTAFNFWFTDQVLPVSNATLRNLLINISRKKPTLELREQVINEIPPASLFLRASRIDATSGRLRSVTIYDMGNTDSRRVIYADSGIMGFTTSAEDLQFRLFSGTIHTFKSSDPGTIQVTDFVTNNILVRGVSNRLDLDANDGVRGDREMSTCEMMGVVRGAQHEMEAAWSRRAATVEQDLQALLGLGTPSPRAPVPARPLPAYCQWFAALARVSGTVSADSGAQLDFDEEGSPPPRPVPPRPAPPTGAAVPAVVRPGVEPGLKGLKQPGPPADAARAFKLAGALARPALRPDTATPVAPPHPTIALTPWGEVAAAMDQIKSGELRADQYEVEVHKKWAISVACLVFVIVGIPMALRFPRGGMGLVIGGGLFVFAIYYVGLIAGEGLGDKDIVDPWVAMWAPNLVFLAAGVYGLFRVSRESGSTRGGDLAELWDNITYRFRRRKAK
jgi:lipopolysaccharide export system permease protein